MGGECALACGAAPRRERAARLRRRRAARRGAARLGTARHGPAEPPAQHHTAGPAMDGGAFGAGKAGGAFDPQAFLRQPHTLLRLLSWVRPRHGAGGSGTGVRGAAAGPSAPPRMHARVCVRLYNTDYRVALNVIYAVIRIACHPCVHA